MNDNYEDIINLPHHVSKKHPQMSMLSRAAQFAPFAALSGHNDAIKETARLTESQKNIDESNIDILNRKISYLYTRLDEMPFISITYFKPDEKKNGGSYQIIEGNLKEIDEYGQTLILTDKTRISIQSVFEIESNVFPNNFE
ncbi:MAG: hypothetical protein MJ198_01610 [Bacteroidales bacterium]|nr:hypothetical protein [Bacteroidales bacterium]